MTEKEYDEKFKEYLKEKGPNPGKTFFEYQIEIFEHDEIHNK